MFGLFWKNEFGALIFSIFWRKKYKSDHCQKDSWLSVTVLYIMSVIFFFEHGIRSWCGVTIQFHIFKKRLYRWTFSWKAYTVELFRKSYIVEFFYDLLSQYPKCIFIFHDISSQIQFMFFYEVSTKSAFHILAQVEIYLILFYEVTIWNIFWPKTYPKPFAFKAPDPAKNANFCCGV